jgi:NAD-dependent dihydropyrimidine dehydrogenase PreA subunit
VPWVIGEPCIDIKDRTCVEVCPADCIYELTEPEVLTTPSGSRRAASSGVDGRMLFIHPDECIDCGVCEPVCPVDAIREAESLPPQWAQYRELNQRAFTDARAPS